MESNNLLCRPGCSDCTKECCAARYFLQLATKACDCGPITKAVCDNQHTLCTRNQNNGDEQLCAGVTLNELGLERKSKEANIDTGHICLY